MTKTIVCFALSMLWASSATAQSSDAISDSGSSFGADKPAEKPRRAGPVVALRAGTFGGSGSMTAKCEGSDCSSDQVSVEYDEVSTFKLGGDLLFNVDGTVRLGVALGVVPFMKISDTAGESDMGTVVSVGVPAELMFDLSPKVAFTLRAQLDALILVPGDDMTRAANDIADICGRECKVDRGPYFGVSGGIGPGIVIDMGSVGLRADLMVQGYSIKTLETEFRTADAKTHATFSGVQTVAMAGVEF